MKRAKHTLSHYRMVTARMGDLVPVSCVPVIPGDTLQHRTSALVRVSPLNTPVMHPVNVRIHHFFVPNRIIWSGWEDFITGGKGDGSEPQNIPLTQSDGQKKSLLTYLGIPPLAGVNVNALPMRAANAVYNEYYRDNDLVEERDQSDRTVMKCAWEKDYFTTSRPWAQKGPEVTLPVGTAATVRGSGTTSPEWENLAGVSRGTTRSDTSGGDDLGLVPNNPGANTDEIVRFRTGADVGLIADLADATAININEFRRAFAIQRYQEARSRYGSRFTEYLRYLGITPSDARLQRPEYLGGGSTRLNFSEVLQTTPGGEGEAGVGDLYGHGIAGVRTNAYRKFFEEHGYVLTFMSVRPKTIYANGVPREFLKRVKEDFYQKELVNLGQQPVDKRELFLTAPAETFGYQDRYDEYRQQWSQISQDFRDTLSSWHLGRFIEGNPALNEDFITCDPDDRIYQVQSGDHLWCMVNHSIVARRLLPKRANPRII